LKKRIKLSRRNFVGLAAAGTVGSWFAFTNFAGARFVRQAIQETTREIAPPKFKPTPHAWSDKEITATWIGHASVLLNFYGLTILTDPVMMDRVGLGLGLATVGPKRLVATPLSVKELPPIDLLLLSHAHMDHFDVPTLQRFGKEPKCITARATQDLFAGMKFQNNVKELGWDESTVVKTANGDVQVKAFEVNHWGARWRTDKYRGYNGYVLERGGKRLMFGGDTAMTDKFQHIHTRRGYDLAIMPIGSYKPYHKCHCTPEQSVAMLNDAGAEKVLPIHFKTFRLGEEGTSEPMERLESVIAHDRIGWRDVGETFKLS
jgi:L-ascorbate metabolism protein UlaG (beta-lactamase superfamily)